MKLELRVGLRIIGMTLIPICWGAILYRFFTENDYWMVTALIITLFPSTYVWSGIDDDLRLFYKKHKKPYD